MEFSNFEGKRFYSFRVVTYAKPDEFLNLLNQASSWEYIYHDKDNNEPHYHINLTLPVHKTVKQVCSMVQSSQNTMAIPCFNRMEAHNYLTHVGLSDKFQYSESLIVCSKNRKLSRDVAGDNEQFILTLERTDLSLRQKAIYLGRDFIKNYKFYESFIKAMHREESDITEGKFPCDSLPVDLFHYHYIENVLKPCLDKLDLTLSQRELILSNYFS